MRINRETGQGVVEYTLIIVLVAIVVIYIMNLTGNSVADVYCQVFGAINLNNSCSVSGP